MSHPRVRSGSEPWVSPEHQRRHSLNTQIVTLEVPLDRTFLLTLIYKKDYVSRGVDGQRKSRGYYLSFAVFASFKAISSVTS
jgi:hypothetical protein